ncbi:probable acyl-CoA dehydrogenase IBR3 isoform X2 [Tanacetum coccineum]
MGHSVWAAHVVYHGAPDTWNMEVLLQYGTKERLQEWLIPLLNGTIRSGFAMIEPQVASSDATNIEWETDFNALIHRHQSMILVDINNPDVTIVRPLTVFGFEDAPYGHAEISFENHAYPDGRLEETVLRHLGAEDRQTVIAKDIRRSNFINSMRIRDLSVGIFQGPLPPSIAMLTHLMELNVSNNPFTNNIPMFPSAFVLTSMYPSLIFDL